MTWRFGAFLFPPRTSLTLRASRFAIAGSFAAMASRFTEVSMMPVTQSLKAAASGLRDFKTSL